MVILVLIGYLISLRFLVMPTKAKQTRLSARTPPSAWQTVKKNTPPPATDTAAQPPNKSNNADHPQRISQDDAPPYATPSIAQGPGDNRKKV